jgi:DNA-binding beta-propeller fold protein YncE
VKLHRATAFAALCAAAALFLCGPSAASAAEPLFIFTPPADPEEPTIPPPAGQLEGPCGLAVDSAGDFYVADHYHDVVDVLVPPPSPFEEAPKVLAGAAAEGPCGLAVGSTGSLYVNDFHGKVAKLDPSSYPVGGSTVYGTPTLIDPGPTTGVALDPASGNVYVDDRDHVSVYEPGGAPVQVGGAPLVIGEESLGDGYGVAVSGYPATAGFVYVPDAATETVKVYDPSTDPEEPTQVIAAGFSSLRDAAIAVNDTSGEVYVLDDLQPQTADFPEAAVFVFDATGAYEGRLAYNVIDARPAGLAVDNSGGGEDGEQGRVYVTSSNTERASVFAYGPGSAGSEALPALEGATGGASGGCACAILPEPPSPVTCEGDSCQHLPSEPTDPTLNTLVEGEANPPVRFHDTNRLAHYRRLRHHHHAGRKGKRGKSTHRGPRG